MRKTYVFMMMGYTFLMKPYVLIIPAEILLLELYAFLGKAYFFLLVGYIYLRLLVVQPQVRFQDYLLCAIKASFDTCLYSGLEAPNTDLIYILESAAISTRPVNGL